MCQYFVCYIHSRHYPCISSAMFIAVLPISFVAYTIFIGELFLYFVRYIHGYMKFSPCPRHPNPLALISARASTDTFQPIDCSSAVRGCNIGSILMSFVASCNTSVILSCNSLCLKVTNPPFLHDNACWTVYTSE